MPKPWYQEPFEQTLHTLLGFLAGLLGVWFAVYIREFCNKPLGQWPPGGIWKFPKQKGFFYPLDRVEDLKTDVKYYTIGYSVGTFVFRGWIVYIFIG